VEFFQFFLTSLNFTPVLLERNLNLSEKIKKIPKNRIHCNIQSLLNEDEWRVQAVLEQQAAGAIDYPFSPLRSAAPSTVTFLLLS
jgi:hypothetical protein